MSSPELWDAFVCVRGFSGVFTQVSNAEKDLIKCNSDPEPSVSTLKVESTLKVLITNEITLLYQLHLLSWCVPCS